MLAVTLAGGENEMLSVYGTVTVKNTSAMNTVILILHFSFFKYNRSILGCIF